MHVNLSTYFMCFLIMFGKMDANPHALCVSGRRLREPAFHLEKVLGIYQDFLKIVAE